MNIDAYCRWLSRYFFAHGYDSEDLYQEARLAAWQAPGHERVAARRQVLDIIKLAGRRPQLCAEVEVSHPHDTGAQAEARLTLQAILEALPELTEIERRSLAHVLNGEKQSKQVDNAIWRARKKLALAAGLGE